VFILRELRQRAKHATVPILFSFDSEFKTLELEQNMLKSRKRADIARIESSFRTGSLRTALKSAPQIERRANLSPHVFDREFRKKAKPVVIEGLMGHWPALKKWSFDYLAATCGSASVTVDSYDSQKAREMTFAEFVNMLKSSIPGEPLYLQEWLYMADCPFLAEDLPELLIAQYDFRRNLYGKSISTNHQLWIGQAGGTTRFHQDSYFIDVMHAQIVGEKHWSVMNPKAYVAFDKTGSFKFSNLIDDPATQMMQCVLKPGDVIYLPALWWHRIELLTDSIGLGRKCLDKVNLQKHIHARFAELLSLALNHDAVKETYPELYKVVVLRNQAWAKLMNIDLARLRPS